MKSEAWKEAMANRRGRKQNKVKQTFKCDFCGKIFDTSKETFSKHIKYFCCENPNRIDIKKRVVSEETRRRISEARKKYLNEHPEMVPFKLNHSSKESYPEKYFREWLQKENIFSEKQYQVDRYTLDFAWPEKGFYIEIDGGQHNLSWMKEHDIKRTQYLLDKGWVLLARVYWPRFQSFSKSEKADFLVKLKKSIETAETFKDFKSEKEKIEDEKMLIKESCKKEGKINKLGRCCPNMKGDSIWEQRKNLILSCGVDLMKFGCLSKIEQKTGLTRRQIKLTIEKFGIKYQTHKYD